MRPIMIGADAPKSLSGYDIEWSELVTKVTALTEADLPYLAAIARVSNRGGVADGGIFALAMELKKEAEAERLMSVMHGLPILHASFAGSLLGRTAAATALHAFGAEAVIASRVERAEFEYLSPLLLEGTMAVELFFYGMYDYFHQNHSANDARALTRQLLLDTVGDELESIIPLTTREPWGDWFDPHSCGDRSWLLLERRRLRAWLFAFSHSD